MFSALASGMRVIWADEREADRLGQAIVVHKLELRK